MRGGCPSRLGGLEGLGPSSTVILVLSGSPAEAGFLWAIGFRQACSAYEAAFLWQAFSFSGAPGGLSAFPAGDSDEVRLSLLLDVPFPRLSRAPSFPDSPAARVLLWQWLPSPQAKRPLLWPPPQILRLVVSSIALPFVGSPTGGAFLASSFIKGSSWLLPFGAADLSG